MFRLIKQVPDWLLRHFRLKLNYTCDYVENNNCIFLQFPRSRLLRPPRSDRPHFKRNRTENFAVYWPFNGHNRLLCFDVYAPRIQRQNISLPRPSASRLHHSQTQSHLAAVTVKRASAYGTFLKPSRGNNYSMDG